MSTTRETIETNIPFAGFYYSNYDDELGATLDSQVEWFESEYDLDKEQALEYSEILFRYTDWRHAWEVIAKHYVTAFSKCFKEWTEVDLKADFNKMISPREYNFETDRIFGMVDEAAILALYDKVDEATLRRIIEERFTSRSGFISFYPNSLDLWPSNALEWDVNQICTLLMCFLPEDWERDVFEATFQGGEAFEAWEGSVDWNAVELAWAEYLQEEAA